MAVAVPGDGPRQPVLQRDRGLEPQKRARRRGIGGANHLFAPRRGTERQQLRPADLAGDLARHGLDAYQPAGADIDRPFERKVNVYLGPRTDAHIDPEETNLFLGICQQHNAQQGGTHLPGCPPHAEVLINGLFSLFPDVERPKYADKTEEAKLEEMLKEVLASIR